MIDTIFLGLSLLIKIAIGVVIGLIVLRGVISWLHLNPFGWVAYHVRLITEPIIAPLRRNPVAYQSRRDIAPVLVILMALLLGFFCLQLLEQMETTIVSLLHGTSALARGNLARGIQLIVGAIVFGVISMVVVCIILQVVFSWVGFFGHRLSRLVSRIANPILDPFRRMIPPIGGMFDISPIIAIIFLNLIAAATQAIFLT
jgi:YggT family protein